jgi:hypothetical protein
MLQLPAKAGFDPRESQLKVVGPTHERGMGVTDKFRSGKVLPQLQNKRLDTRDASK